MKKSERNIRISRVIMRWGYSREMRDGFGPQPTMSRVGSIESVLGRVDTRM